MHTAEMTLQALLGKMRIVDGGATASGEHGKQKLKLKLFKCKIGSLSICIHQK